MILRRYRVILKFFLNCNFVDNDGVCGKNALFTLHFIYTDPRHIVLNACGVNRSDSFKLKLAFNSDINSDKV